MVYDFLLKIQKLSGRFLFQFQLGRVFFLTYAVLLGVFTIAEEVDVNLCSSRDKTIKLKN